MRGAVTPFPIRPHGVVLEHRDKFTFRCYFGTGVKVLKNCGRSRRICIVNTFKEEGEAILKRSVLPNFVM
jgi:hypothetical protein